MAVIQVQQKDIVVTLPGSTAAADFVVKWNKPFTDSIAGAIALGERRVAMTYLSGNRWRIPAFNLWTEFGEPAETGVLYQARVEAAGLFYIWDALNEFRICVPGPDTAFEELIADERLNTRGGTTQIAIPIFKAPVVAPDKDAIFVIAEHLFASQTPLTLRFGRGKRAPFIRIVNGVFYYSADGMTQAPIGSGGTGVTDGDKGDIVVTGSGAIWSLDAAILAAINPPARSVNANTALNPANDGLLLVDTSTGNVSVTLNAPTGNQRKQFFIKKVTTDGNAVVLTPAAGTIDGAATYEFSGAQLNTGNGVIVIYDGANWHVFPS